MQTAIEHDVTGYENNVALINKTAHRIMRRISAARLSMELEDVIGEIQFVWLRARASFDPSKGNAFSTYFMSAIYNHMNRLIDKRAQEEIELGITCVSALIEAEDECPIETHPCSCDTPEQHAERIQQVEQIMAGLSEPAQLVVGLINNPPPELQHEFACKREKARIAGSNMPKTINLQFTIEFVQKVLGLSNRDKGRLWRELKSISGREA